MDRLHAVLQEKRKALVSAGGGYGKTQAALEYVKRFGGYYEDVLWVRAADGQSLFESYRTIARGWDGCRRKIRREADVQRALKGWVAGHPAVLVVFDNVDDPDLVKAYWPSGEPGPFLLATSRKPDVSEVARMEALRLDVWEPAEAVEFLMSADGASGDRRGRAGGSGETGVRDRLSSAGAGAGRSVYREKGSAFFRISGTLFENSAWFTE